MTHAGEFLRQFCAQAGGQREFARQAGLDEGHLSKILRGGRRAIRSETFGKILEALPADVQGKFLTAYVSDLVPEEFAASLFADDSTTRIKEMPNPYGKEPEVESLIASLRKNFRAPQRGDVAQMLQRLAENGAASPDFLRGMEYLAKLRIS